MPRVDAPSKVNGTAAYGIDVQLPDMLYAAVLYPPVQYQKPEQIDDTAAKAVKGVVNVVPLAGRRRRHRRIASQPPARARMR